MWKERKKLSYSGNTIQNSDTHVILTLSIAFASRSFKI